MASHIENRLEYLKESRPTAVDLANAISVLKKAAGAHNGSTGMAIAGATRDAYIAAAEKILEADLKTNLAIGENGAEWLKM